MELRFPRLNVALSSNGMISPTVILPRTLTDTFSARLHSEWKEERRRLVNGSAKLANIWPDESVKPDARMGPMAAYQRLSGPNIDFL